MRFSARFIGKIYSYDALWLFFFFDLEGSSLNPNNSNRMEQAGKKAEMYHTANYKFSEYFFQGNKVTPFPGICFRQGWVYFGKVDFNLVKFGEEGGLIETNVMVIQAEEQKQNPRRWCCI